MADWPCGRAAPLLAVRAAKPLLPQDAANRVVILLALRNGAAMVGEQVESYLRQSHPAWDLIVSDDGSSDDGAELIRSLLSENAKHRVTFVAGPQQGASRNFLYLLSLAKDDAPFAALSDQDDVWLDDKLERALEHLSCLPRTHPAVYCGRTIICDSALRTIGRSPLQSRPACFRNALVQNIAGGNTMVLNRAAIDLLRQARAEAGDVALHDMWIYQIVTGAGGTVVYDSRPSLRYRQHSRNTIGANMSLRARLMRAGAMFNGSFKAWNVINIATLEASAHRFTAENQAVLSKYSASRRGRPWSRLARLRRSGVHCQRRVSNLLLQSATLLCRT